MTKCMTNFPELGHSPSDELSRLRRDFSDRIDRINKINIILLFSLYLPAGRQVLNIVSIPGPDLAFVSLRALQSRRARAGPGPDPRSKG